jgi:hypothetical protein
LQISVGIAGPYPLNKYLWGLPLDTTLCWSQGVVCPSIATRIAGRRFAR